MILSNFTFADDLTGLETQACHVDLHSNYAFAGCFETNGCAVLSWQKLTGSWVSEASPNEVRVVLETLSYLERRGVPSDTLMEFGFFQNDSLGQVEYNGCQNPSPGCELLLVRFENGAEIAALAERATVEVSGAA